MQAWYDEGVTALVQRLKSDISVYIGTLRRSACKYYSKLPDDIAERQAIIIDPMLATGVSAITAINELKKGRFK